MRILAVDPGGTTGWAFMDGEPESVFIGQEPGGLLGFMRAARYHWLAPGQPDVIVIEKYTIGARTVKFSRQDDALRITGALEDRADEYGIEVVKQKPGEAMRLFTDERLRAHGWWATGKEHGRDAARHLGFYLARKRLIRLTGDHSGQ